MAMPFCSGGSLSDILRSSRGYVTRSMMWGSTLPLHAVLSVAAGVLRGIAHIHGCGYAHNQISPEHILLEADRSFDRVRLTDLSRARPLGMLAPSSVHIYSGPETFERGAPVYSRVANDVHAFGMTILEMMTGMPPYWLADNAQRCHLQQRLQCSARLAAALFRAVLPDPAARTTVAELQLAVDNEQCTRPAPQLPTPELLAAPHPLRSVFPVTTVKAASTEKELGPLASADASAPLIQRKQAANPLRCCAALGRASRCVCRHPGPPPRLRLLMARRGCMHVSTARKHPPQHQSMSVGAVEPALRPRAAHAACRIWPRR